MSSPSAPADRRSAGPRRRQGEFGAGRKFTPRRKVCAFCVDKIKIVDYKDLSRLRRFLSERGKIEPRRKTGTCAAHQRSLNVALKNARLLALLPFTAEHIRITGVPAREPGGPQFRGPRPPRFSDVGEAPEAPVEAPAEISENGAVTAEAGTPPSADSPETVAQAPAAQGADETPDTGPTTPEA